MNIVMINLPQLSSCAPRASARSLPQSHWEDPASPNCYHDHDVDDDDGGGGGNGGGGGDDGGGVTSEFDDDM